MHYIVAVLSLLFVCVGGFLLMAAQISEYGLRQRPLNNWIHKTPVAHRGFYDNTTIPENSLSAFKAAVAEGYAIELDVHLSQDGEVVVFHDHDLERATGQMGRIIETAYSQFQGYFLWYTQETIPTLQQALALVQGQVPLFIEIKNVGEAGLLEQKVNRLLTGYNGPVIILSFNARTLEWFRVNAPEILRGQNLPTEDWHSMYWFTICRQTFKYCKLSKPHVIIYNANKVSPILVRALAWFKPFIAYNVTSHEIAASLKNIVTNIIFDHFDPNNRQAKKYQ